MNLQLLRVLDDEGRVIDPAHAPVISDADLRRIHEGMLRIRLVDERMLRLQRQGRIGFYLTATGEEATHIGPTYALRATDWIYPAYREIGAAFFRGYSILAFMHQMFGDAADTIKGRQMPVHHSIRALNCVSISSPVGTQIPQAVGIAMAARRCGKDDVCLVYFGDGATSTGAFHVGCNLAAVEKAPCIFLCRNNGWAISVPSGSQTATATMAQKAIAYGMPGVLCDGNDVLALVAAVRAAAERARRGDGPTLIEARTYRIGAHSSSDDPSVYRDPAEPSSWAQHDPVTRFAGHLAGRGLWNADDDKRVRDELDREFAHALQAVEATPPRPPPHSMFEDVFAHIPWHLREQADELAAHHRRLQSPPDGRSDDTPADHRRGS